MYASFKREETLQVPNFSTSSSSCYPSCISSFIWKLNVYTLALNSPYIVADEHHLDIRPQLTGDSMDNVAKSVAATADTDSNQAELVQ